MENEIFGPGAGKTVTNGGHYVRGKCGMTITEALHLLQVFNFLEVSDRSQFQSFFEKLERFKNYFKLMNYTFKELRKAGKNVKNYRQISSQSLRNTRRLQNCKVSS